MADQKVFLEKLSIEWGCIILAALLTCAGNLSIKYARLQGNSFFSPAFILGLCCYGVNILAFARALDRLPISVAYPVFAGLGFILIAVFSKFLFGETLDLRQWVGIGFILIGLACMAKLT